jgi:uncharacterized protein YjiK
MKNLGHNKIVILITAGLLLIALAFIYSLDEEATKYRTEISNEVKIEETWKLPSILREVSGIAFFEPGKIAAVQDERGSIFIYNLRTSSLDKEIKFTGKGDYEGITIRGDDAYVLESNGNLFVVKNFLHSARTEKIETFFTSKSDMEGLFYDKSRDRLLLALKGRDPNFKEQKGIYTIQFPDVEPKQEPLYILTFKEEIFNNIRKEDIEDTFFPSEIAVDPGSGEILVLEARHPRLLILDPEGVPKALHVLDPKLFPQPEGLTFDNSGSLYISNEGKPATIHRVKLN